MERALHAGGVQIMTKHDGAVFGIVHDGLIHRGGIPGLPVIGIQIPGDHRMLHKGDVVRVLSTGDPDEIVVLSAHGLEQVVLHSVDCHLQFPFGELGERFVIVGMVGHLAVELDHAFHDLAVFLDAPGAVLAGHEERGDRAPFLQTVQQHLRIISRTVIKGKRDQFCFGIGGLFALCCHRSSHPGKKDGNDQNATEQKGPVLSHFHSSHLNFFCFSLSH